MLGLNWKQALWIFFVTFLLDFGFYLFATLADPELGYSVWFMCNLVLGGLGLATLIIIGILVIFEKLGEKDCK